MDFVKTYNSAPEHTFTSSNIDICSKVRTYVETNKEPHSNLVGSQKISCFTGNGPDAHRKLVNAQAYINEANTCFSAKDHMKNWRMVATEEGVYDRLFHQLHPFVGDHPTKWIQLGISGEVFWNTETGAISFMEHKATWRVKRILLETGVTEPEPTWAGSISIDDDRNEFQICRDSSSGTSFVKHFDTNALYRIKDTSPNKTWEIQDSSGILDNSQKLICISSDKTEEFPISLEVHWTLDKADCSLKTCKFLTKPMLENISNAYDVFDCQNVISISTNVLEFLISRDLLISQYKQALIEQWTQQLITDQTQGLITDQNQGPITELYTQLRNENICVWIKATPITH